LLAAPSRGRSSRPHAPRGPAGETASAGARR